MKNDKFERIVKKMEVQLNLTWKRESKLIENSVADVQPVHILEIGSGPGVITAKLSEMFPNAMITALEMDKDFVNYHKENMPDNCKEKVRVICADITDTVLEEDYYDLVYVRLVLQHVHDVDVSLKNIHKSMKKGGKIIITDVDEGLFGIIDPPVPELEYILGKHIEEQVIEGGDRYIGRKLWRKLNLLNFRNMDLQLIPVNSDEVGINSFIPQVDYEEMGTMIENDLISNDDINKVKTAAGKFFSSDYPFALLVLFYVSGVK